MASRRSRVRTPPAPPTIEHAILRLHSAKRIQRALLRRTNKRSWRASGLPQRQLLARIEESRSLEACLFRRVCHSECGSSTRNANQEAEGSTLYRRVVERVPVKPGRSRVRTPPAPPVTDMRFHVYILRSESSERFYAGQTKDLAQRVAYHNADYSLPLKNRGPWKLVYSEVYATRSEAVRRETQIKRQKDRHFIDELLSASR
jgi:putative endonuclease